MSSLTGRLREAAGALRPRTPGRLRIAFVVHTLDGAAGTERAVITQANALVALPEHHQVHLVSVVRSADRPHFPVDPRIDVTHLVDVRDPEQPRALRRGVASDEQARTLAEREATIVPRRWDATFSALTDVAMQEFLPRLDADVVVTTIPELLAAVVQLVPQGTAVVHQEHRASSTRVHDLDALLTFAPRADVVASLTGSMNDWLATQLRGAAPDMVVLPNPLPLDTARRSPLDSRLVVAAGRLSVEKRWEQVIDAFAMVADELPGWRLQIWGDGPRREFLEAMVRRLDLTDRIELPGTTDDMAGRWADASVAVLASRAEGFPLVLQEAMAAGVPVVSYDVPAGPREIVTDGVDGFLVAPESRVGLAHALGRLALDDDLRARMGAAARLSAQRWSPHDLALEWVEVFHRAVARRGDLLAPRKVLHGRTTGPLGTPSAGSSAAGVTPEEARRTALRHASEAARRAVGRAPWWVVPPHGDDPTAVVVVPAECRDTFLDALLETSPPPWLCLREPDEHDWPERRGTLEAMVAELRRARGAAIHLEPWPVRGGHHGLLAEQGVRVEFWAEAPDGSRVAPSPSRYGPLVPAGTEVVDARVWEVDVRAVPSMLLPTVHDVRFDVDVVFTWVDGDDPEWQARREERLTGRTGTAATASASGAARFRSRDELRWAMRSIHLFAPWVRRIHLVTAGQAPPWLDTSHEQVALVDHRDIFPADALPTFNSHAIESRLHHVPDLTEHFLYLNDDVALGRPLRPERFFLASGSYGVFEALRPVGLPGSSDLAYLHAAWNNQRLLAETFGAQLTHTMVHSPQPMRRSVLQEIADRFPEQVRATTYAPFRSETDLSLLSSFAQHYGLLTGAAHPATAEHTYIDLGHHNVRAQLRALRRRDLDFFCIADNHHSAYGHDEVTDMLTEEMQRYFPVPAPWEK